MKKIPIIISSLMLSANLIFAEDITTNSSDKVMSTSESKVVKEEQVDKKAQDLALKKEDKNKEFLFIGDITLSAGMTYATIDDIVSGSDEQAGIVETDPIRWGSIRATFFPGIINLDVSYGRTFSSPEDKSESTNISKQKNTAEQLKINIPISSFLMLKYKKYSFNSSFEATKEVRYVDRSNTTAASGTVYPYTDSGITNISIGDIAGATIDTQRFDLSFVFDTTYTKGLRMFTFGIFQETLEKPWSDTRSVWTKTNTGEEVAYVYKDARFESTGITYGLTSNDKALREGFSLSNMSLDLSVVDISLTDNFTLEQAYENIHGDYVTFYKTALEMEFAYKTRTRFLGDRSNLLFALFGKYDYYYADGSTAVDVSDDYFYGFRGSLTF